MAVVGGGVIGLLCAYELDRAGAAVVVLERDAPGAGCSLGNGGWVCPSLAVPLPTPGLLASLRLLFRPQSPLYIAPAAIPRLAGWLWAFRSHCNSRDYEHGVEALGALGASTLRLYGELEEAGVAFEREERGMLLAYASRSKLEEGRRELEEMARFGVGPVRALGPAELAEAEPDLAEGLRGGLLVEGEAHVRPETLCAGVAAHLAEAGVEILSGREVRSFATEGRTVRAALASGEDIEADAFVLACGAETGLMTRLLDRPLPVTAGKGYSITVDEPAATLRHPAYLPESKVGFTPFEGAIRILGTMELSGINRRLDRRRLAILERAARAYLPGALEGARRRDWVGMRPVTPDGLPIIGRLAGWDNAWVATGHQMLGVTLAPATGRALAESIAGGEPEVDLAAFDPARF